jgi:predicted acetyltransferase
MEFEKGYKTNIDERFSIHIAGDNEEELKALVKLNLEVHQKEILGTFIPQIFLNHPRRNDNLWIYIKDNKENRIVTSICLSPLEWQIEDTVLPVCQMEFVGTLEKYRGKGFIKILNKIYEEIMEQKGYILSVIVGIPYFYRSLEYEFVSSLDERISIPVSKISTKTIKNINIRKANFNDLPFIKSKYNEFHKKFYIFNKFDPECFKFMYLREEFNSEVRSTYIFNENGVDTNYFSFGMSFDNQYFEIISPDLNKGEMITLLQFVKNMGDYNSNDTITLSVSEHSSLFDYILSLGGKPVSPYGWQVKIPNLHKFFSKIKRIIENRVNNSEFKGLTKIIRISNYRETIIFDFIEGIIKKIKIEKGYPDLEMTDLRIPGAILLKLILGDNTIDEINYIIKDAIVNNLTKSLIETMFPKKRSLFSSYL